MNHRGGEIGEYVFEKKDEGKIEITAYNPYPALCGGGWIATETPTIEQRTIKMQHEFVGEDKANQDGEAGNAVALSMQPDAVG